MADNEEVEKKQPEATEKVTDEQTSPNHVYTKDELVKLLANTTEAVGKVDNVDPKIIGDLQKVSSGISQAFSRVSKAQETNNDLLKTVEDYKAKIAAYAADQAERMKAEISKDKPNDAQAVENTIKNINNGEDE